MNRAKKIIEGLSVRVDEKVNAMDIVKELIDTSWSGSNKEQGKAVQLLRGLAFSDDPVANEFMKALDKWSSALAIKKSGKVVNVRGQ